VTGDGEGTAARMEAIWRRDSRRVLATLIRLLGGFDAAEEALHDAFAAAAERWPRDGVPANPFAWLVSAGRFRAIDRLRRRARLDALRTDIALALDEAGDGREPDMETVRDDQLRLIFTCCHPALAPDARIAMTLRELCGLTTEEIAHAFLVPPPTIAQRIVRAKAKIRDARIRYEVPSPAELPDRLESVLHVVYLVFNEGYSASAGAAAIRIDLAEEAIRLARLLVELMPDPEAVGLLSLLLLQHSRRAARLSRSGDLVLLPDQDRRLWDRTAIAEGRALAAQAVAGPTVGAYALQAAIAAVHAAAENPAATDWPRIVALYDLLMQADPAPVVALNRAVAVAMRDGPGAGLALIDGLLAEGALACYHLAHAARADLLRRLGRTADAAAAYRQALALARQEPERRFLERRLSELGAGQDRPPP
jgi:RNA polymerase sigma-70 factor (ECF subfamily)